MAIENPIYFDYNATTPVLPEVVDAMLPYLREHFGNPSSSHAYGIAAQKAVAIAREQVAVLIGCDADAIIFTSGGTEANNLAIRGACEASGERKHIVTSQIEHPATSQPVTWLERHGYRVDRIAVDGDGRARVDAAEMAITSQTTLITIMHSNNETGVLQPVRELARFAHAAGAIIHTDAAQSIGKVGVNVGDLEIDLLSIAGHKLYAPKGVGALYIRRGIPIAPFALGAGHERGLRPGTENVASIVGLGAACLAAGRDLKKMGFQIQRLRDLLWDRLVAAIPEIRLNGHKEQRLPNTLNIRFPRVSGNTILAGASGIAASTGSACHTGGESASSVILAMGVSPQDALGSVRLTLGRGTNEKDVERAASMLIHSWRSTLV